MQDYFYLIDASFCIQNPKTIPIKKILDFEQSLKKAKSGHYTKILIPEIYLELKNLHIYIHKIKEQNLKAVFAIHLTSLIHYKPILCDLDKLGVVCNVFFEDVHSFPNVDLNLIPSIKYFTLILTKNNQHISLKKTCPAWILKNLEVYAPYKKHKFDSFLIPRQIYKFIKRNPSLKPFSGEIYDSSIPFDMDLEPLTKPVAQNQISHLINFSIVIPNYNNKKEIVNTLQCLIKQDYPTNQFEIIVVDDGSTDQSLKIVQKFLKDQTNINWKIIHFPRVIPRKSGDCRFRAGIARNLGVKYTTGHLLAFLDADILVPPDYLKQLEKEHKNADVIQVKRYHLKSKVNLKNMEFDSQILTSNSYIEDKKYWETFYNNGFQSYTAPWKFVCTYGLSLTKEDFLNIGRFGRTFLYYGFEDTDLGYRLYKKNKKLKLSSIKVYHQPISLARNEYRKNIWTRYRLLSKTAKIFFYKHLDPLIYEELKVFMKQERGLLYFMPFLKSYK